MSKLIYVKPEGNLRNSRLFIVGEAPGQEEESEGRPFVGRCGRFLRETLAELGFSEDEVYFTNAVKVRPQDNRRPTQQELGSWVPLLVTELNTFSIFNPRSKILTLGRSAEFAVKCTDAKAHHVWHPSYVLRFNKKNEWLENIKVILSSVD